MLSYHTMAGKKGEKFNFIAKNSLKPHRFDEAFEPYRSVFIYGDNEQQNFIVNEVVSNLITAESSKLKKDRTGFVDANSTSLLDTFTCNLCEELFHNPTTLVCGHSFCLKCIEEGFQHERMTICPECGQQSRLRYASNIVLQELLLINFPERTHVRNCIADATRLLQEEKLEDFLVHTEKLGKKFPENVELLRLRANGYESVENYCESLRYLDIAYDLAPCNSKVLFARGEILANVNRHEEATTMFLRAAALKPNHPRYRSTLIWYLAKLLKLTFSTNFDYTLLDNEHEATTKKFLKGVPTKSDAECKNSGRKHTQIDTQRVNLCQEVTVTNPKRTSCTSNDVSNLCATKGLRRPVDSTKFKRVSCIRSTPQKQNISSELECKLCFNMYYLPITTPCGHTLCRSCLERCLDHRIECPCCRTNLEGYLEHFVNGEVGTSKVLESILLTKFKHDYEARREAFEKELVEFSRCETSKDEIPIFVCTLAVPGVACPLHIFEPRYKLMIRRSIESGSRQFGMCVSDPKLGFSTVGTMLYINDAQFLPDGRSIVHTVGTRRFRVLERSMRDGYNTAKIAWLEDEADGVEYTALNYDVYRLTTQWLQRLSSEQRSCIVKAVGPLPDVHQSSRENGPSWLWWLLAAMPLNFEAKQIILSMTSVTERLSSTKRFLALLLRRL